MTTAHALPNFCKNVTQLKRVVAIPGITLERLPTESYLAKPARTIAKVTQRAIMFSDGAYLAFPTPAEFSCIGDVIQWGRLSFRVSITPELYKSMTEAKSMSALEAATPSAKLLNLGSTNSG